MSLNDKITKIYTDYFTKYQFMIWEHIMQGNTEIRIVEFWEDLNTSFKDAGIRLIRENEVDYYPSSPDYLDGKSFETDLFIITIGINGLNNWSTFTMFIKTEDSISKK